MLPSLAQLVQIVTASNAYQSILGIANTLGLQTTAWQPLGMGRTILATMSQVVASASSYVNLIAQGGYATTAAAMTDANGNPITTWMDLVSEEQYGVTRNPATAADGVIAFGNGQSVPYGPFPVGTLHLKNGLTGATYSNTLNTEQIFGNAGSSIPFNSTVHFEADQPGIAGTATVGTVLILTTPLAGVTVLPLGVAGSSSNLVGTASESNQALLARDINKLGSIAPNGAGGALEYVATTQSIIAAFGAVSAPVTRAFDALDGFTGVTTLWIANAAGPSTTPDVAIVQAAEQALAVPTGMTLVVAPATANSIVVNATIYIMGSGSGVAALAEDLVVILFGLIPIGGLNGQIAGEVSRSSILAAIQNAAPFAITEINLASPPTHVALAQSDVPVLDPSSTFTVVVVNP